MFPKISDQSPGEQFSPSWPPVSSELCWHCPASFPEQHKAYGESHLCFMKYLHYRREGLLYIVTDLWREGGGNCNQVSRSQFSQLHIIIRFRYLIQALKLKTHLEWTIALLSHRLLCREISSACPSVAIDTGTDHASKTSVLNSLRKGKGIKKLNENACAWHSFVSDAFSFLPNTHKWKGRATGSLAPSPLPETEWGLQNFLLLSSYLRKA